MREWILRNRDMDHLDPELAEKLDISPLLLQILWNRGFKTPETIIQYLTSPLRSLTPPEQWPQIPLAAKLLTERLLAGKKLAIWGDYDVDGITATALALDLFEFHGFETGHYLPDRRAEGYGLNIPGIEKLAAEGFETLLTVDCGISDIEPIKKAMELGLAVIVSDHHLPPSILPPASAIVNPRLENEKKWPFTGLAGVGVAFYLLAMVNKYLEPHTGRKYRMAQALDLVCLGTLADIMPLSGENRALARGGLKSLEKPQRVGFAALKAVSGLDLNGPITSGQTVFRLAPRINAAGRMGSAETALNLLRTKDFFEAERLASELESCNIQRKAEEERIFRAARKQAQKLLDSKYYSALVLYGQDWHSGIIGIVASRIVEEFERPVLILCEENGVLKGSGRSWADFDLYAALNECSNLLLGFGGHKMAAGVTLLPDKVEALRLAFSETAKKVLGIVPKPPTLLLECELSFTAASDTRFIKELDLMQPFGPDNPEPVFVSLPLVLKKRKYLGRSGEHLLLELVEEKTGKMMSAKAWRMASALPESLVNQKIRIAFTPRLDMWNGYPSIDLGIKDWKRA